VVEGKLKQEGQVADEGGGMWIANGFFYVEDYSRRVFFSSKQVYEPMSRKYALEDPVKFHESFAGGRSVFPISEVQNVGAFDKKAERRVTLTVGTSVKSAQLKLTQHIIKLTPTVVEMQTKFGDAPLTNWFACYLTRELDPDEMYKLLSTHKD